MSYRIRYTKAAREDLRRLYAFLLEHDLKAARRALDAVGKGIELLREFPFTCRKTAPDNPFLRELVIPFGTAGYVALFEVEDNETVTILAVRHQRHRIGEYELAENHQKPRLVPQRRCVDEIVLPGNPQHQPEMDHANQGLESSAKPLFHPVRGSHAEALNEKPFTQNR